MTSTTITSLSTLCSSVLSIYVLSAKNHILEVWKIVAMALVSQRMLKRRRRKKKSASSSRKNWFVHLVKRFRSVLESQSVTYTEVNSSISNANSAVHLRCGSVGVQPTFAIPVTWKQVVMWSSLAKVQVNAIWVKHCKIIHQMELSMPLGATFAEAINY